jgi:hypothetical protein
MVELRLLARRAALVIGGSFASAIVATGCFGRSDLESIGIELPDGGYVTGAGGEVPGTGGRAIGAGGQVAGTGGRFVGAGGQIFGTGGATFAAGGRFGTGGTVFGTGGQFIGTGGQFATGGQVGAGGTVSTGGVTGVGGFTPACNATTCSSGCCDGAGQCQRGRTDSTCGVSGQACSNCGPTGERCAAAGFCYAGPHCGADNCGGCCTPDGQCRPGTGPRNCGIYGSVCENCNSQIGETCQAGACAAPGATCPAAYGGCAPGAATSPPTSSNSCSAAELATVAKVCAGTGTSSACTTGLSALARSNPACFGCVGQFLYDGAVVKCLAPFLSASCNESLTCATDCSTGVCSQCTDANKQACQTAAFASGAVCNPYVAGYYCAAAAFGSSGAFCDAARIGDTGAFLQGVGAYYCSK